MSDIVYTSRIRIERSAGPLRLAYPLYRTLYKAIEITTEYLLREESTRK